MGAVRARMAVASAAAATIALRLSAITAFYDFAVRMGCLDHNPALRVHRPIVRQGPPRGLEPDEIRRLLVPGGRFHFLDHGLAPDESVRRWQRRLEPLQSLLFGGCKVQLEIDRLIREAGFEIEQLETFYMPGPRFSGFMYRGVARSD